MAGLKIGEVGWCSSIVENGIVLYLLFFNSKFSTLFKGPSDSSDVFFCRARRELGRAIGYVTVGPFHPSTESNSHKRL